MRLQFCVPNTRLERRLRAQLSNEIPGIGFADGTTKLLVAPGNSIGGGLLTTGREDRYPLETASERLFLPVIPSIDVLLVNNRVITVSETVSTGFDVSRQCRFLKRCSVHLDEKHSHESLIIQKRINYAANSRGNRFPQSS